MKPSRLLLLCNRVPYPPDRGDRIRSYHLLRYLAARARVCLACPSQQTTPASTVDRLAGLTERMAIRQTGTLGRAARAAVTLLGGRSASEGFFAHPGVAASVSAWARDLRFDAVVCSSSAVTPYARLPELRRLPLIVDLVDVDSDKWRQCAAQGPFPRAWLHRWEASRVARLEHRLSQQAAEIIVVSQAERALYEKVAGSPRAVVAPNGVDAHYFQPEPSRGRPAATACFVGVLNYQPNVDAVRWFVEAVWPLVRSRTPSATLLVVGRNPDPAVRRLCGQPGVELHADVPDVRPFLSRSRVAIAPLRIARGLQNKVLEAMAMELPVVASRAALQGISAVPDRDLLQADAPHDWAAAMTRLFRDDDLAASLGRSARAFVLARHSWDACLAPLGAALARAGVAGFADEPLPSGAREPAVVEAAP